MTQRQLVIAVLGGLVLLVILAKLGNPDSPSTSNGKHKQHEQVIERGRPLGIRNSNHPRTHLYPKATQWRCTTGPLAGRVMKLTRVLKA
jgi:hypothetical protein